MKATFQSRGGMVTAVGRHRRWAGIIAGMLAAMACFTRAQNDVSGYANPEACATCHRDLWETYRKTAMARSFYPPPVNTPGGEYYHAPSDSTFTMLQRDGQYYQRRHQIDFAGREVNVMEKRIDYVMGSGDHARAYLSRTSLGTLVELPLGWYAEKGGYWAMNPGYDRSDHDGFRRPISYDCMFCHNGYPQIPAGHDQPFSQPVYGSLPEGIDCQRCHGPGLRHIELAKTKNASPGDVRSAIVNPSRLSVERQMEACMVCHLETTSFPLPNAIQRYDRGPFSYKPGQPLSDFILNFDHAPGTGHDDKFELVNAAYRLRRSACFLQSSGKLLCTTCHNPHDAPRGEEAARHYTAVCRQCHPSLSALPAHRISEADCVACHMPTRRTEDVVHVVATDHYIQRRKPAGDLLAEIPERRETYRGPVVLYYPETLPHTAENDLDSAIAQVNQKSNLRAGIAQLAAAIERYRPQRAEYYLALAEAWRDSGQLVKAIPLYREAVRRNPKFALGLQKLGSALRRSGQLAEAEECLKRSAAIAPSEPLTWHELGLTYRAQRKIPDAVAALQKTIGLDPDMPEAHNNLGIIFLAGEQAKAEAEFREAIRIQPDYADAHGNLASLLSNSFAEARYHFDIALKLRPDDAATRYNYAMALGRAGRYDYAQRELETSLHLNPQLADAHLLLADLLMAKGDTQLAAPHYREAVRIQPESGRAHLGLGLALVASGAVTEAVPHLQKAAAGADPSIRADAAQALRQIGR